jgi:thioredoxin reductase
VGGGPAGLSAALVLGRSRLRARVRDELARYPQVRFVAREVDDAVPPPGGAGLRVVLDDGTAGRLESTTVPGIHVAGNILRDVQRAVVAAGADSPALDADTADVTPADPAPARDAPL